MIPGLGARITAARTHAGLSLSALARTIGLTRLHLTNIERGVTADPGIDALAQIAKACLVSLDSLLEVHHVGSETQWPATLGARITWARKEAGLSETTLANRLGLTRQTMRSLENGTTRNPHASTVKRIAEACEVTTDWLMGLSPQPRPQQGD